MPPPAWCRRSAVEPVRNAAAPTPEAVAEIEAVTQHDVIAFLSAWADNTEPRSAAAYVHFGMTSSDLLDTALALQLVESTDLLLERTDALVALAARPRTGAPRRRCGSAAPTACTPSRTSSGTGSPTSPSGWLAAGTGCARPARTSPSPRSPVRSGPTPTSTRRSSSTSPASSACSRYRSRPRSSCATASPPGSPRSPGIATLCEAIALEVRHGQRTEVRELEEPFGSGQKGSSAMPHKRNPIISERICGLARIIRGQIVPVMEGVPLWHERDISHSSVERVALPDAAIGTDYLLHLTSRLVNGLTVNADRMLANLESTGGLIYTSAVLLELVEGGLSREDAYALTQAAAMRTWETGVPFRETLTEEAKSRDFVLDDARLDEVCRPQRYLDRLGPVFDRLAALT